MSDAFDAEGVGSFGPSARRDEILVDLNRRELNCPALDDAKTLAKRKAAWAEADRKSVV